MPWTVPTAANALTEFNSDEKAQVDTLTGDSANLATILARVVAQVRGDIRAGGYPLDADTTKIPDSLHGDCIAIARWRLLISLPKSEELQTEHRKAAFTEAIEKLKRIAAGDYGVEQPTVVSAPGAGSWNSANKLLSRTHPQPRPGPQGDNAYANPDAPQDEEAS